MRRLFGIASFLAVLVWSGSAWGQYWANDDRPEFITSTTTTTSAVVVGVIVLTVVNVNKEPTAALRHYLEHNEAAVRAALSLGGGDALADLGAFFGVYGERRLATLGRVLRRERRALADFAWRERDVPGFVRHLRTAMRFEPSLRELL